MSNEVPDLRGDLVTVGDTIAYAATDGRSSGLRIGKVLEVVAAHTKRDGGKGEYGWDRKVPTKLRVGVALSTGYGIPEKPVLIEARFKRFVKVND